MAHYTFGMTIRYPEDVYGELRCSFLKRYLLKSFVKDT